jgi:hypothetical protein
MAATRSEGDRLMKVYEVEYRAVITLRFFWHSGFVRR